MITIAATHLAFGLICFFLGAIYGLDKLVKKMSHENIRR